jgi:2'-5' RNA ligase
MSGGVTKNSATLRTFIAIDLPKPILDALAAMQEQLQSYLRSQKKASLFRWSPTKNLHLTLRFLGETTPSQSAQIVQRLQTLAATCAPFNLQLDLSSHGLGGFPNLRQPRVLWMGLAGELATLQQLQAQVEIMVQTVGFAPEERAFAPHLTLARAAQEAERRALQEAGQLLSDQAPAALATLTSTLSSATLNFDVDRLIYYQSELGSGGARYNVLAEVPLAGS